jgi:mannose-6-phosphate isomerase-like protein (cupin superfamily)
VPDQPYHAAVDGLPKYSSPDGAVQRAILETDGATIQFTWVAADTAMVAPTARPGEPDRHWFDQTHLVISGRLAMTLYDSDGRENKTYEVGPGELLYIPGDVPHRGRSIGGEPVFAIEVFAPPREDFHHMAAEHQPGLDANPAD